MPFRTNAIWNVDRRDCELGDDTEAHVLLRLNPGKTQQGKARPGPFPAEVRWEVDGYAVFPELPFETRHANLAGKGRTPCSRHSHFTLHIWEKDVDTCAEIIQYFPASDWKR